ncbi:MAG: lipid-A-disaccharide synthase, partial [Gammaproteobacteria bacterium]
MSNKEGSSPFCGAGIQPESPAPLRIGLVAGESSGDLLGAGLIRSIRAKLPNAEFAGMAGPRMEAEGCACWETSDRIAIMGLGEVLRRLGDLIRLRKELRNRFEVWQPDVFVGIDSPDFNLGLEIMLRSLGVPTVHYVSPSLWAWRPRRVKKIARAADLVLCLLPFETAPYEAAGIASRFVGHPLADHFPTRSSRSAARQKLGMDEQSE